MGKAFGLETRKSTRSWICSKELPLLNLANGYQLLRSFGKTTCFWNKDKEKVTLLLTKAQNT
jgi:hypothetical protein